MHLVQRRCRIAENRDAWIDVDEDRRTCAYDCVRADSAARRDDGTRVDRNALADDDRAAHRALRIDVREVEELRIVSD